MFKLIGCVYLYLVLQMSLVWVLYRVLKNPSVVDVSWSLGIMITGLIYLFTGSIGLRSLIISALLICWGLRLAFYLWFTRVRMGHVDKRYLELSSNWKIAKSLGFFLNFQLQAIFILIISSVFLISVNDSVEQLSYVDLMAALLVMTGILGESIADWELYHFRKNHKGRVCNMGLWNYSRHPNYFFEWLVWCGFALFCVGQPYGYLGVISPLWLYFIFSQMTIPITERGSLQSKGEAYVSYQKQTSIFFPWFKN